MTYALLKRMCLTPLWRVGVVFVALFTSSCGERGDLAPVSELKWQPFNLHQTTHTVTRGETLYAVAFRYDKDYRQLAAYNRLKPPYALRVGQVLRMYPSSKKAYQAPHAPKHQGRVLHKTSSGSHRMLKAPYRGGFMWPTQGRVVSSFAPSMGKKGIHIAGQKGQPIRASANGVVAYEGNGLPGYGNLIIIKHGGSYLTAYGNNLHNRVKEGQKVKAGQIIADMGLIDRRYWGLHFEIRQQGQPVNPLQSLPKG